MTDGQAGAPVAAIDCGTNTIRLLVGTLPEVAVRESRIVRLGQGVDATGRLAQDALERTFAALDDYAEMIRSHGADRVRMCATSAVRDASNGADFIAGVRARLGVDPDILTGEQEARLAYAGATRDLRDPAPPPVVVVDIGGGSTELVDAEVARSLDIGSVRLHERHLHDDPPTPSQVAACVAEIDAALATSLIDLAAARTVVLVAGTALTVAACVLGLDHDDRSRIDQARLQVQEVTAYVDRLVSWPVEQRLALPFMNPGRADVIGAGGLILARVLARTTVAEVVASEADILDGIAWSLVV